MQGGPGPGVEVQVCLRALGSLETDVEVLPTQRATNEVRLGIGTDSAEEVEGGTYPDVVDRQDPVRGV